MNGAGNDPAAAAPVLEGGVPVLPVRRTAEAAAFWRDRLGFRTGRLEEGYAVLARDRVEINLWAARDGDWRTRPSGCSPVVTGAETFLAGTASCRVRVAGIEAPYHGCAAGVVHPTGPLADKRYGLRESAVLDGDRNLVTRFEPIRG